MKLLIIANRSAGAAKRAGLEARLGQAASNRGLDFELIVPSSAEETTSTLAQADLLEFDAVIAAGGDGTLFRVLNGVMSNSVPRPIGVIPMGTGNAFARDLGLSGGDIEAAMDLIADGRVTRTDVGEVRCHGQQFCFLNVVGLGFVVDAGLTAARLKFTGSASYSLGAAWNILRLKSRLLQYSLDGREFATDTVLLELSNSRYTGTDFLIAPKASLDDGLLDLTLLKRLSRFRLARLFPTIYSGGHVRFDEVETAMIREVELSAPRGLPLMADGELIGKTPATIRCLPGAVELLR